MKCVVCRRSARIKIARHNSAFCDEHFEEHILRQISKAIKEFKMFRKDDKILLAVSGGKDSMGLWRALADLGYNVFAIHINNGFGEYSEKSEKAVRLFAEKNNLPVQVYSFRQLAGFTFEEARRFSMRPVCSLCGALKRYMLNKLAIELGCDVVVTGHNLDDETAFLLGNLLHWKMEYISKQYPVLGAEKGLVRKVKPLIRITDREMALYTEVMGIEVIEEKCPNSRGATSHFYKKLLDDLEKEQPGSKSMFYFGFLKRLRPNLSIHTEEEGEINYCKECGYKTTRKDKCFVCNLKEMIMNGRRSEE